MSNMNVTWQFQAAIAGGPSVLLTQPGLTITAYDFATVDVVHGGGTGDVTIPASGNVVFLVISSSVYDSKINYTVDGGTKQTLDGPLMLVGGGTVGLLNSAASPQKLAFTNGSSKDATVQVVAGRNVP